MDKFDESVKRAREIYEPSERFVENAMIEIMKHQPVLKKGRNFRLWIPVTAGAAAIVVVASFMVFHGRNVNSNAGTPTVSSNSPVTSAGISTGTSNASLVSDLSNVQSSMNQENSDQNSASRAINDQQQEITVPTD